MNVTVSELDRQVGVARASGWDVILGRAERERGLPGGLLLAIASRETGMSDVVADGGHGRGLLQIDDRAHPAWLAEHGAGAPGTTPPVADAASFAAALLVENREFGRRHGVKQADRLKFAVSAYNAGPQGALNGYVEGDSDARTTGRDYARDVLERRAAIHAGLPGTGGGTGARAGDGILRVGSRGARVTKLKEDLAAWLAAGAPGEWDTFGVRAGPLFGERLEQAVRRFQELNGLTVDGEVGPETLGVLSGSLPPPAPSSGHDDLRLDRPRSRGSTGEKVRLIQAWLSLHGFQVAVDGGFGPATESAVARFQTARGLPPTGVVDEATYAGLVRPMLAALAPIARRGSLGELVVAYARQHLAQHPVEIGGANAGPWVRLYTDGHEGPEFPWCAGFATFCLEQACATLDVPMPVARTLACDELADSAPSRLLRRPAAAARGRITPGSFFLKLAGSGDPFRYGHMGIVVAAGPETFESIEGNTNDDGSSDGFEVCARTRGYARMDFVVL
jgi:peptidoglycan hydrolase-like protein with peptidoglycan-binding domain